jgi:outer membrane protein assembly factor BamB
MKQSGSTKTVFLIPVALALLALVAFGLWLRLGPGKPLALRVPGTDQPPGAEAGGKANPVLAGKLTHADGQPANLPGAWPQFRGPNRDGISPEKVPLARTWATGQPRELWAIDVGEGYAGAAILNGRVYVMDYDREHKQDALRCLSLADGREIWRYAYPVSVKRNHGMSRTVPAVTDKLVVAMGPKCHVVCLNSTTGELLWGLDLVRQYGATVPPWYAGQCPLIDNGAVILAPGGEDALLLAVEAQTGKVLWQTPNPHAWKMTHSSVMPMEFDGQRMYVYCASKGVVGVSAKDGSILWETPDWKISIATVPSPLPLAGGRVFLTGGYNAGSLMLQLTNEASQMAKAGVLASPDSSGSVAQVRAREDARPPETAHFVPRTVFKLEPEVFGATQHTPILYDNHFYGVRADGKFVCLTLDGKVVWTSGSAPQFGLGNFILTQGLIFAMNDSGLLRLIEATPQQYVELAQARVLKGRESWAPLALADGRLIARDLTRMVCLEVSPSR